VALDTLRALLPGLDCASMGVSTMLMSIVDGAEGTPPLLRGGGGCLCGEWLLGKLSGA